MGVTGVPMAPTQGQTTGGFDAIRQAGGLSPANSNAPEPLPADVGRDAAIAPYTQGVLPLSTALRPMLAVGLLDGVVSVYARDGRPARPRRGRRRFSIVNSRASRDRSTAARANTAGAARCS